MNKKLKAVIVLSFLFTTSFLVFIPTTSSAALPTSYVTITLKNSQSTATPENFTQLIKVNWSAYATDLNANVSNVRFYNSTSFSSSTELSGWIETNNTTTATSSNVWVNLSDTIVPASSTVTIYMAFLPTTSSWSSHWGLAPELSTVYGKFDNGAKVFTNYWNFAGTSLPSGWTYISQGGSTYSVNNGITFNVVDNNPSGGIYSSVSISSPIVIDAFQSIGSSTAEQTMGAELGTFETSFGNEGSNTPEHGIGTVSTSTPGEITGWAVQTTTNPPAINVKYVNTFYYVSGSLNYLVNYTSILTATNTISGSESLAIWNYASTTGTTFTQWIRTRAYPPDGVMPSVTFGSLTTVTVSGYQISFQQTSLLSRTEWGIRLNNTTKVVWQNSTTQYDNITGLSAGSYTFQVINATGYASNPYTGILTIVSTNLTQSITFTGYQITYNETGLPIGSTWYVNLTDQSGLSESSTGQKLSGTTSSLTNYEPNGTYTFTYHTSDKKYSGGKTSFTVNGASVTESVKFTEVLYYLNFTSLSKPKSLEWGVNVSGTVKTGYGNLSFQLMNGTYYWNASAINGSFANPVGYWRLTNESGTVLLHNESSFKGMKIVINGNNYNNNITFARAYNITFEEVGIQSGIWDVNLTNGFGVILYKTLNIHNGNRIYFNSTEGNYTNGSFTGSLNQLIYGNDNSRYLNSTASTSISISIDGKDYFQTYYYVTQYYLRVYSYPLKGGISSPFSGWYNESQTVSLTAIPSVNFQFLGFIGSNTSSYTGFGTYSQGEYIAQITMTNSITENATFGPYVTIVFYAQNVTSGIIWGVALYDSSGLVQWDNASGTYIVFDVAQNDYTYKITNITSIPQSGDIDGFYSQEILITTIVKAYKIQFKENGLQPGTSWSVNLYTSIATTYGSSDSNIIAFILPNDTYDYTVNSVYGYLSNQSTGYFTVSGFNKTIYVNWTEGNVFIIQNIKHFIVITLNTSNFSIPADIQIPITVNWSKYKSYENDNLSNVLFMNNTFYPLYAWIENNASVNYTASTVWVKLTQSIPDNSSSVIYLAFQSKDRNNFNSHGYLGEASQYSKPFGAYNNIAMVMNKGLAIQFFTNQSSNTVASIDPDLSIETTLYNASMSGSIIPSTTPGMDGLTFTSLLTPEYSGLYGTTQNVPYHVSNGAFNLSQQKNVLLNYYLSSSYYPGTFPSPLFDYASGNIFFGKAQGFVDLTSSSTSFYGFIDDGTTLGLSNNGTYTNWLGNITNQNSLFNKFYDGSGTNSAITTLQGTYRISNLYVQAKYPYAYWNLWTNYKVNYYSPTFTKGINSLEHNITFGPVSSAYSAFYEYGLPINTNWSIAISGPNGFSKLYTTNSNLIYTYLPSGTYIYTVGSMVNGSYHSGVVNVGTTHYVPNPSNGHVIVTGVFTVQYVIFAKNDLLEYDLIPGQAQYSNGSLILPIFVLNQNNQPANTTVIKDIWQNMSLTYLARLQNQTETIPFTFSTSGLGMFAIFFSLNVVEVKQIKSSNATLSMVSDFSKTSYYTGIATGIAGSASFVDVVVNGQNISSVSPPGVTNTTTNTTGVPWYIGLIANTYPTYSPNALIYLENIVIWILANAGGRALTLIVGLATLLYFAWIINKARKDKGDKKWKFRVEKKLDVVYRKILREPIKQKSNNETSES